MRPERAPCRHTRGSACRAVFFFLGGRSRFPPVFRGGRCLRQGNVHLLSAERFRIGRMPSRDAGYRDVFRHRRGAGSAAEEEGEAGRRRRQEGNPRACGGTRPGHGRAGEGKGSRACCRKEKRRAATSLYFKNATAPRTRFRTVLRCTWRCGTSRFRRSRAGKRRFFECEKKSEQIFIYFFPEGAAGKREKKSRFPALFLRPNARSETKERAFPV